MHIALPRIFQINLRVTIIVKALKHIIMYSISFYIEV